MTNTTDDIAARLRATCSGTWGDSPLVLQADDTIDRLTREWDAAARRAEVLDHMQEVAAAAGFDSLTAAIVAAGRATTAEAALSVAREALDEIKAPRGIRWRHDQTEAERTEAWRNHIKTLQGIARAALNQITLKEKNDD